MVVPAWVLIIFLIVITGVIACNLFTITFPLPIIKRKVTLSYLVPPIVGILLLLVTLQMSPRDMWVDGVVGDTHIKPYTIIILVLAVSVVCVSLDFTGALSFLAFKLIQLVASTPIRLFTLIYGMTSVLSAVTSNDVMVLTLTPVVIYCASFTKSSPYPYLFATFAASNLASIFFVVGNPTNVIIADAFEISFFNFSFFMIFPAIVCLSMGFLGLYIVFRHELEATDAFTLPEIDPFKQLRDPIGAIVHTILLLLSLLIMTLSSFISKDIKIWMVACGACGVSMIYNCIRYPFFDQTGDAMDDESNYRDNHHHHQEYGQDGQGHGSPYDNNGQNSDPRHGYGEFDGDPHDDPTSLHSITTLPHHSDGEWSKNTDINHDEKGEHEHTSVKTPSYRDSSIINQQDSKKGQDSNHYKTPSSPSSSVSLDGNDSQSHSAIADANKHDHGQGGHQQQVDQPNPSNILHVTQVDDTSPATPTATHAPTPTTASISHECDHTNNTTITITDNHDDGEDGKENNIDYVSIIRYNNSFDHMLDGFVREGSSLGPQAFQALEKPSLCVMNILKALPWGLVPFVICMFILIQSLVVAGWVEYIGDFCIILLGGEQSSLDESKQSYISLFASFVFAFMTLLLCNLMNNQPATILLARVLQLPIIQQLPKRTLHIALYSVIAAANYSACLTIIAALAGILFVKICKQFDISVSYLSFLRVGIITVPLIIFPVSLAIYISSMYA